MKRLSLLLGLLVSGCMVISQRPTVNPPMPPGVTAPKTNAPAKKIAVPKATARIAPAYKTVVLAFEAQTTDTNFAKTLLLGLKANPDPSTTNWSTVWAGPYPASQFQYAMTNIPGSYWTSNYLVTIMVTLSNQPPDINCYRAFYTDGGL